MSLKIIDRNRGQIRRNADKVNILIHNTAMLIANHAKEHGDCTRAQMLLFDLPESFRRTQLALWFHMFTPIVVKEKDAGWQSKMHKVGSKAYVDWDLEAAAENPWYKLAEANPEDKELDFDALVKLVSSLAKRIETKVEKGKVKPEDQESAKAIAARLSALRFDRIKPANEDDGDAGEDQDVGGQNLRAVA